MTEPEVPGALARLWRVPDERRLGRPAELDVERVVRAAVEIADAQGLAAVTLSKVAASLGFTTMSLYRHVGSKDELYVLMGDLVGGEPPAVPVGGDWRAGLHCWAHALRARHAEHPWLARLPISGPPSGPGAVAWLDAGLRALRDTPLDWGAKVGVMTLLSGFVRSAAQLSGDLAAGRAGTDLDEAEVGRAYGRALAGLVDPGRFPDAAELFRSGLWETPPTTAGEGEDQDPDFTFGLRLVLDGVAAAVEGA